MERAHYRSAIPFTRTNNLTGRFNIRFNLVKTESLLLSILVPENNTEKLVTDIQRYFSDRLADPCLNSPGFEASLTAVGPVQIRSNVEEKDYTFENSLTGVTVDASDDYLVGEET